MQLLARVGWQINHLDIAPRYAGVLVGITMTSGMLAGVLNPLIISVLVINHVRVTSTAHLVMFAATLRLCDCVAKVMS